MRWISLDFRFEPISNRLSEFETVLWKLECVRYEENPFEFYKETAYNKKVDNEFTYYYFLSKIKIKGEKNTRYLTHGLDFYKGNFQAQMIRALINLCNLEKGSILLDIFCGSGTTLIESKLLGFNSFGIDINPIACLNSIVKTRLLDQTVEDITQNNEKYFDLNYFNKYCSLGFSDIFHKNF